MKPAIKNVRRVGATGVAALTVAAAVVVPGTRPKEFPAGTYQVDCALIIGWRRESHDERLSLNETLREFELAV